MSQSVILFATWDTQESDEPYRNNTRELSQNTDVYWKLYHPYGRYSHKSILCNDSVRGRVSDCDGRVLKSDEARPSVTNQLPLRQRRW